MTDSIELLRKSMRAAQVFGKGQYILNGQHHLHLQTLRYKCTVIDGVAKESIAAEFTVILTTNPEIAIGETRSTVYTFDKKGWLSRFKAMTLALCGVDPYGRVIPEAEQGAEDVYAALKFDSERVRLQLPEDFMSGRQVRVEGIPGMIKTGPNAGKAITDLKWIPVPANEYLPVPTLAGGST
jgi:hypothetical protein